VDKAAFISVCCPIPAAVGVDYKGNLIYQQIMEMKYLIVTRRKPASGKPENSAQNHAPKGFPFDRIGVWI